VRRAPQGRGQRGFALLLVIWVLAILAVLAAGFAAGTRSQARLARNLLEAARARALAEAGVARAISALVDNDPTSRWRADGTPSEIGFDGGIVRVRIEDEGGKVDLNMAPPALLSGLCLELGIDPGACTGLVDDIVARRRAATPAFAQTLRGPRAGAGLAVGFGVPPMQDRQAAAFSTVAELRQVPALDQASFDRLRPFVTVYSQSPRVDPAVAPREVLLAIPGVDPREVEQLLVARQAPPRASPTPAPPGGMGAAQLPTLTGVDAYAARGQLRTATIIAEARTANGGAFTRRAVMGLTGVPLAPTQMLEWRQDFAVEEALPP
jgi:general secretion pathway protein K